MNIRNFNHVKIVLIGLNHFDILGREKLQKKLVAIKNENVKPPLLIATEYPLAFYDKYEINLIRFKEKCKVNLGGISDQNTELIVSAYMYELDLMHKLFPSIPKVELRNIPENSSIEQWEDERIVAYKHFIKKAKDSESNLKDVILMNNHLDTSSLARDNRKFCELLFSEIEKQKSNSSFLISITGSHHIETPIDDSMEKIFNDFGFSTEVIYIDKNN
jgi:hypothetical protein